MKESVVATILFADLMDSTEMAKNLTLQEKVGASQDAMRNMVSESTEEVKKRLFPVLRRSNVEDWAWPG